jgi:hypothetical protein
MQVLLAGVLSYLDLHLILARKGGLVVVKFSKFYFFFSDKHEESDVKTFRPNSCPLLIPVQLKNKLEGK